jgi:hypothetical protein
LCASLFDTSKQLFMGFFSDILLGKQVTVLDKILGELKTRIKNENPSANYTWTSEHLISGQRKKTVFILEGNYLGPDKNQLKSVYRIIDNLQEIMKTVDQKIKGTDLNFNREWSNEFHLAAITPIARQDNRFEVTFEPLNEDSVEYVSFVWENEKITEIVAK